MGWRGGIRWSIAALDTGIDADQSDLTGRVIAEQDFTGSESGPDDRQGRGTHVAGTIGGDGTASAGRYRGVAPDVHLLNGKVLDDFGSGEMAGVIAGMQWAASQGADVVNLSLSGPDTPGIDPMEEAVDALTEQYGTLFVVAAGNSGPGANTIGSPGSAAAALTVGASTTRTSSQAFRPADREPTTADSSRKSPHPVSTSSRPEPAARAHPATKTTAPCPVPQWRHPTSQAPLLFCSDASLNGTPAS
ncbi:S8 family serine peptidase [Micromonospora sp. STR1s_5]|nr:S8 family serine peptidase [Micromonospora sp. STR1s_5]